jgi:hypothetical protein
MSHDSVPVKSNNWTLTGSSHDGMRAYLHRLVFSGDATLHQLLCAFQG